MEKALLCAWMILGAMQEATKPASTGWSPRNWIGFFLYIVVFLMLVAFIFYVGRDEDPEEGLTEKPS